VSIGEYDEKHEWPELAEWPELMPNEVSADFVERTFKLVREDQLKISTEAAQVEDIQFPGEFLSAYAAPDPSADFTGQLMSRMNQADRSALASYSVPEPSADFVERTLAALHLRRHRARRETPLRALTPWAALAAILLATLLLLTPSAPLASTSATAYSSSPWGTLMAQQMRGRDSGNLSLSAADPLLLLASGALAKEED
jgi:hypothetical protein